MKNRLFFSLLFLTCAVSAAQILKQPIPDRLVVLTFDDAPASQYSVVAPLLKEYGFNATFFVCEFPPNYSDSTLYMNWRQIKKLDTMGFEIANHTRNHANVSKLKKEGFDAELSYIEHVCDSLNIEKPKNFAYPGYGLDPKALSFLQDRNYVFARAGGSRPYNPIIDHPYLIPSWATDENNEKEILEAFTRAKNGKITILTLHGVPDIEHPWVNTSPELFKKYLEYLSKNNYTVIALRDLEQYVNVKEAKKNITPDFNKPLKN